MMDFYAVKGERGYMAYGDKSSQRDQAGLYWNRNVQSARRYRFYDSALKATRKVTYSTRIVRIVNGREVC